MPVPDMSEAEQALWDAHPENAYPTFETHHDNGHLLYRLSRTDPLLYADTQEPFEEASPRPCALCGAVIEPDRPDPCLGWLPGVRFACCGHGVRRRAYVTFENGVELRGFGTPEVPAVAGPAGIAAEQHT